MNKININSKKYTPPNVPTNFQNKHGFYDR